jgi:hypothetical protein
MSDFLRFAPKRQIKSPNVVMRVTDDPVGNIYRSQVKDVASAQPNSAILYLSRSIITPFCY